MISHIRNSAAKFDSEVDTFFQRCRRYRSNNRKGAVLVVDEKNDISDFLSFLVEHCQLKIDIIHIPDASLIGETIDKMGGKSVKAVIVDSHVLRTSATVMWMDKHYPNIPMFISNCGPNSKRDLKKSPCRAGFLSSQMDYVDALGLPEECNELAVSYGG